MNVGLGKKKKICLILEEFTGRQITSATGKMSGRVAAHPLHSRSVKDMCTAAEAVSILIRFKAMKREKKKKVAGSDIRWRFICSKRFSIRLGIQSHVGVEFRGIPTWPELVSAQSRKARRGSTTEWCRVRSEACSADPACSR